jgi:hypothetical protein
MQVTLELLQWSCVQCDDSHKAKSLLNRYDPEKIYTNALTAEDFFNVDYCKSKNADPNIKLRW